MVVTNVNESGSGISKQFTLRLLGKSKIYLGLCYGSRAFILTDTERRVLRKRKCGDEYQLFF